jgi:hypothetical protein
MLSPEVLDEWFDLCLKTGELRWKKTRNGKAMAGSIAGAIDSYGYLRTMLFGKPYYVHRIIYCMINRKWPKNQIDHIDNNKLNNVPENLREATTAQNSRNRKVTSRSTSGLKGAYYDKRKNKWRASIKTNGKFKHIGHYETAEEAHAAYCKVAEEMHGEFARFK